MTDIVERLRKTASRGVSVWGDLQMEAAAEIDRLTRELANARAEGIHSCHDGCTRAGCVNARLREEVEQLRNYLDAAQRRASALGDDAQRYHYLRNRLAEVVLSGSGPAIGCWIDCENEAEELILLTGNDADAAIDHAMGARKAAP